MCGLVGCVTFSEEHHNGIYDDVKEMTGALSHRGPDSEGFWFEMYQRYCRGDLCD